MMSAATADGLLPKDDAAIWAAIARHGSLTTEPLLVSLPSFGGDGGTRIARSSPTLERLGRRAVEKAKSYLPYEEEIVETDPDEAAYQRELLRSMSEETLSRSHYRWFLRERVDRIRWLDGLRKELVSDLLRTSVASGDTVPVSNLRVEQWGALVVLTNDRGGRAGRIATAVARTRESMRGGKEGGHPLAGDSTPILVLANENDRPAALRALSDAGIDLPFDPAPGWLNVTVEPGAYGWLVARWRGQMYGLDLEADLAYFHIEHRELRIFAPELRQPIERLMHRIGHIPANVVVEAHPDDPEGFFGMNVIGLLDGTAQGVPRRRKLRPQARRLLPAQWAQLIEDTWCPGESAGLPPWLFKPPTWGEQEAEHGNPCRLCDGVSGSKGRQGYCADCCTDARTGLFRDDGFNRAWNHAVIWSLRTVAEVEFGGAPAANQLATMPANGPNTDLLMLCRMITARGGSQNYGSDQKSHSWTDWLARAGLLTEGVRRGRGGVTVTAKDGHICRSMLERQIDDFFYENAIEHETEPHYPYDPELNVTGYRADWKLADGTFVEALGFPANSVYMEKAQHKRELAEKYQIPWLSVMQSDIRNLESIFRKWIPPVDARPASVALPVLQAQARPETKRTTRKGNKNYEQRAERIERCHQAVQLQKNGASREQIAEKLQASPQTVKTLLRDGKFYSDPASDSQRFAIAKKAFSARNKGMPRAMFGEEMKLSHGKTIEAWRDADALFDSGLTSDAIPDNHISEQNSAKAPAELTAPAQERNHHNASPRFGREDEHLPQRNRRVSASITLKSYRPASEVLTLREKFKANAATPALSNTPRTITTASHGSDTNTIHVPRPYHQQVDRPQNPPASATSRPPHPTPRGIMRAGRIIGSTTILLLVLATALIAIAILLS